MVEFNPKVLNAMNQDCKNLRKDSGYIIKDGKVMSAVIDVFGDETVGVSVVTPISSEYKELFSLLDGICVDGKELFGLYKVVKQPEILDVTSKYIRLGNDEESIELSRRKKDLKPIVQKVNKYNNIPTVSDSGTVISGDMSEVAYEINETKSVHTVQIGSMIVRVSKKMIKGYKKNDKVYVTFHQTDEPHLFKAIIDVHKKHYIISNMYLIINF